MTKPTRDDPRDNDLRDEGARLQRELEDKYAAWIDELVDDIRHGATLQPSLQAALFELLDAVESLR